MGWESQPEHAVDNGFCIAGKRCYCKAGEGDAEFEGVGLVGEKSVSFWMVSHIIHRSLVQDANEFFDTQLSRCDLALVIRIP